MASSVQEPEARERLLQAASELFYRDGISATGVDALTGRANVAKATFYRHFPSKDDLVLAWLQQPEARWIDSVVPELERRVESPLGRLVGFWDALGDWLEAREYIGCPFLNSLVEIKDADVPPRREIESYVQEVEAYFARAAAAAGVPDPAEAARQLRYTAMGLVMGIRLERSRRPIETARATTIALLASWLDTTPHDVEQWIPDLDAGC